MLCKGLPCMNSLVFLVSPKMSGLYPLPPFLPTSTTLTAEAQAAQDS